MRCLRRILLPAIQSGKKGLTRGWLIWIKASINDIRVDVCSVWLVHCFYDNGDDGGEWGVRIDCWLNVCRRQWDGFPRCTAAEVDVCGGGH